MQFQRKSMKNNENPEKIYEKSMKIQRKSMKKHENPKKIDEKA